MDEIPKLISIIFQSITSIDGSGTSILISSKIFGLIHLDIEHNSVELNKK